MILIIYDWSYWEMQRQQVILYDYMLLIIDAESDQIGADSDNTDHI